MLLQEGDSRLDVAGDVFVNKLHKLGDEGGQVAGGLPIALEQIEASTVGHLLRVSGTP